jgi:putative ABC transport system permease protein
MKRPLPPRLFRRFFEWYCRDGLQESILGDLEEQFEEDVKIYGSPKAKRRFAWNVIRFFRPGIIRTLKGTQKLNSISMFKNYFTTSIRFILREKSFALMNIGGLALGIACALILYKIIDHQLSFDKHHEHYAHLFRVNNEDDTSEGKRLSRSQTHPLANALRTEFPQINAAMTFYQGEGLIGIPSEDENIKRYQETRGVAFVEPQFLELFTLEFLAGDVSTALDQPGKVIISATKASKYFDLNKKELHDAIGKSIILENEKTLYVSAVYRDFPKTTDLPFDIIFHYDDQDVINPWYYKGKSWEEYNSATNCFVMLDNEISPRAFEQQLETVVSKYLPAHTAEKRTYKLQALSDLHYSGQIRRTYAGITTTKNELTVLGLIGLFLIITACINFINLSTAQAVKRAKEVGVRKAIGSNKLQLMTQFMIETTVITIIAAAVGLGIALLVEGRIEAIFKGIVTIDLLSDPTILMFLGILILTVALTAGLYPAIVLSTMNPIAAVKHTLTTRQSSGFLSLRRGLVVFQFTISQVLIIGILVLNAQMNYFQNKDLGFNDESIVIVNLPENDSTKLQVLKTDLRSHSSIDQVSFSTSGPMSGWKSTNPIFHPNIEGDEPSGNLKNVDASYFDLYELELIAGSIFRDTDPGNQAIVNRKLTETIGFKDPTEALGQKVKYGRGGLEIVIVGVVEDFHANSLHAGLDNVILAHFPWNIFQVAIKTKPGVTSLQHIQSTLNHVEKVWQIQFPDQVFDFEFYDEQLGKFYQMEKSVAQIAKIFMIVAIIIGALGLYGLVAFMSNQKTKEIGIRKVMGASTWNIWNIFSKELLILLGIAFVLAAPFAYFVMNSWLNYYAYRVTIGPMVFLVSVASSIGIALLSVGYKSLKVAQANPVLSLRDE